MSLALASRRAAISPAWVKNPLWRTARAVPSLDQPFADTKSLTDAVTGQSLVTFTRASSGTYVGSDGLIKTAATNEPRFDHNPTTGESLGLLVEEQRTNLLLRSEDLTSTWLTFGTTVTANATTAPDGTTTADKLINTTANVEHGIYQTTTTSGSNTFTVFAKQAELRYLVLRRDNTSLIAVYDLQAGTVSQTDAGVTAAIIAFPNGWYRCSMTCSTPTGNTVIKLSDVGTGVTFNSTYTGTAGQGIFIWGAQLEAGAFPTSYIPTTTAAATRSADVASITGANFSSWYSQSEGTVFVEARTNATHGGTNSFPRVFALNDGGNNNIIEGYFRVLSSYTDAGYRVDAAGVTQAQSDTNDQRNGQRQSIGYAVNNFAFVVGGAIVNADTSGSVPVTTQLRLGARGDGSSLANGTIRRLCYWGQRLPNSTLQAITQ